VSDPATVAEYNQLAAKNARVTGQGTQTVTHIPCPGCAAPDWLAFPVTAALDEYAGVQRPARCAACGRTFRLAITREGGSVISEFIQTGGPALPAYLPPMKREGG
jgi:hypothetical protein